MIADLLAEGGDCRREGVRGGCRESVDLVAAKGAGGVRLHSRRYWMPVWVTSFCTSSAATPSRTFICSGGP